MKTNLNKTPKFNKYLDKRDIKNLDFIKFLIDRTNLTDLYISETKYMNGKYLLTITYKDVDYYLNDTKPKEVIYSISIDKYKSFLNIYTQIYTIIKAKKYNDLTTYNYMLNNLYYYNKENLNLIINILEF